MGWASAGAVFDRIANALIDANAAPMLKRAVLAPLADVLRDGDWDTVDESIDTFADDPVIASVLVAALHGRDIDGAASEGTIGYDPDNDQWTLDCNRCGPLGTQPCTITGHDTLVAQWAAHDQHSHSGTYHLATHLLLDRTGTEI